MSILPIGLKHGCLTIIAGFEAYQQEKAKGRIERLEEEKQKFIDGIESAWCNFGSIEAFDKRIEEEKSTQLYKVQCKCGRTRYISREGFLMKRHRYCGDDCGIIQQQKTGKIASYPRKESPSYNIEFINNVHETLEILECIDDRIEGIPEIYDKRKKDGGTVYLYKKYRCKCSLCGREYEFLSSDFEIRNDSHGSRASWGYYCEAHCDCHDISSFQWRTIKILNEHRIAYRAEVSYPDLLSEKGHLLRYDFLILNEDGSTKCLVECQGKQHEEIGHGFGGFDKLERRKNITK